MQPWTRRRMLRGAACTGLSTLLPAARIWGRAGSKRQRSGLTLGFGTYGTRGMKTEAAIKLLAEIGYDAVELTATEGWDAEPGKMPKVRRAAIRRQIDQSGLVLASLMENLRPSGEKAAQEKNIRRLREAAELAHDLSPQQPPIIQTVLGGKNWQQSKQLFLDRLGKWSEVARSTKTIIAIKPHRGGGMSQPREAVWLIEQLGKNSSIQMCYDYSHYAFRQLDLKETIRTALPYLAHVAVKDAVQRDGKVTFVLPGEASTIDYVTLLKTLAAGGYTGDICCEVSSAVWRQPQYDATVAARTCYRNMAAVFKKAGLSRR